MIDFGSVPDWLAALFTGAGFGAAVWQLRIGRLAQAEERARTHQEEQERRTAMARSVGVAVTWGQPDPEGLARADYEVLNGSPYAIDAAVLQFASDEGTFTHGLVLGTVLPGKSLEGSEQVHRTEIVFGEITGGAELLFTDAFGSHWRRSPGELQSAEHMARIC